MNLFEIKNHAVIFAPETLLLEPFHVLWKRDKTKDKNIAYGEIAAVYYFADYKSDFQDIMEEKTKISEVKRMVVGLRDDWTPDKEFYDAVDFYKERQNTVTMSLLVGAHIGVSKLDNFYRDVDLNAVDNNGKPIHDAKKLRDNLTGLGSMVKDLKVLEEEVKKELDAKSSRKGGKQKGIFEGGIK